jgi:hypothetical protein
MWDNSRDQLDADNLELMTGGTTRNELTLVDLFGMGHYQVPEITMSRQLRD